MPRQSVPTPRELFARFQRNVLEGGVAFTEDMCAEDIVLETPFSPKGAPGRVEGRDAVMRFVAAGRRSLDVRFEKFRDVVVHETADPEVIVVEYALAAAAGPGGPTLVAPFVVVLRARDGRIAHWREYQNTAAIAEALSGRPPGQPSSRAKST